MIANPGATRLLEPVSTVDALCSHIRKQLFETDLFEPGQTIKESLLATEFKISRHTVRGALTRLTAEGLLVHKQNLGWAVPRFTPDDRKMLTDLRIAIECEAARVTVERDLRPAPRMHTALAAMRESSPGLPWRQRLKIDLDFHSGLVESSQSAYLISTHSQSRDLNQMMLHQLQAWGMQYSHSEWVDSHSVLLDELCDGSPENAATLVRDHILGRYHLLNYGHGTSELPLDHSEGIS